MILYFFVIALVFVTIAGAVLTPTIRIVSEEVTSTGIVYDLKEGFLKLSKGDSTFTESFERASESFEQITNIFTLNRRKLIASVIVIIVFFFFAAYVMSLSYISYSDIINHFMSCNSKFGFVSNYISNLKRSLAYGLIHLCTITVINGLIAYSLLLLSGLLLKTIGLFSAPIIISLGIVLYALKSTIFAGWVPAIVHENKKILPALIHGIKTTTERGSQAFLSFIMMNIMVYVVVVIVSLTTFGAGLVIIIPTVMMFHRTLELVLFYNANDYKYYIDNETVIKRSIYK